MKKFSPTLSIGIIIWFCFSTSSLMALSNFTLRENNSEAIANAIYTTYNALSPQIIQQYLEEQLNQLPVNAAIPIPEVKQILSNDKQNIIFEWEKEQTHEAYHISYLSLKSGATDSFLTDKLSININLDEEYFYHIFCFSASNQEAQSFVNIFIVDRDLFLTASGNPNEYPFDLSSFSFNNFPNPFYQHTTLAFSLDTTQTISIHLCSPENNVFISGFISDLSLASGDHELPIDLSNFPPGQYYGILQMGTQLASISLRYSGR